MQQPNYAASAWVGRSGLLVYLIVRGQTDALEVCTPNAERQNGKISVQTPIAPRGAQLHAGRKRVTPERPVRARAFGEADKGRKALRTVRKHRSDIGPADVAFPDSLDLASLSPRPAPGLWNSGAGMDTQISLGGILGGRCSRWQKRGGSLAVHTSWKQCG